LAGGTLAGGGGGELAGGTLAGGGGGELAGGTLAGGGAETCAIADVDPASGTSVASTQRIFVVMRSP
jgi:hypothetical protein